MSAARGFAVRLRNEPTVVAPPGLSRNGQMIKLLTLLVRRSDLTHAQFVQIWADEIPALMMAADLCRRYVQYRLHPDRVWPPGTPQLDLKLDGIEELWLEGSTQQAAEILERLRTPAYLQHLRNHVGAMATYAFSERRITNVLPEDATGGGMVKRLVPLVRKEGWKSRAIHSALDQYPCRAAQKDLSGTAAVLPALRRRRDSPAGWDCCSGRPCRWLFEIVVRR